MIFIIILFICFNPIIGILFLIYLFINIKNSKQIIKNNVLRDLNPPQNLEVEEEIILTKAPIKNQNMGNNVSFQPILDVVRP